MVTNATASPSKLLKFPRPLWPHQAEEIDLSASMNERGLLFECGTGKTTTSIGWLRWKYACAQEVLPTLILCPASVVHNWLEEIKTNSPEKVSAAASVLFDSGKKRLTGLGEPGKSIFITNYESLDMPDVVQALALKRFQIILCDEMHRLKNHKSKRLKALLSFSDSAKYRMGLTGTPILNTYLDLWAQFRFLDAGKTFGQNFFVYRETYFYDKNRGMPSNRYFPNWVPKPYIEQELSAKIAKVCSRKTKEECLDLPPLVIVRRNVALGKEQAKAYEEMKRELITYIKDEACTASNALVKCGRLIQIASGYLALENGSVHHLKDNPRLDELEELLKELTPHSKVIVWSVYKENHRQISDLCKKLKIPFATITGATEDKHGEKERFQNDPEVRVMNANPSAGGEGITLTQSSYSIYFSRNHSRKEREQSLSRNHRGGSEIHTKITAIDLVAPGTIEEDVLEALDRKEEFSNNVLDRLRKALL